MSKHTPACDLQQAAARAFLVLYGDYCEHCGGAGSTTYYGNRDAPSSDACHKCVEEGICPLCAKELTFEKHDSCDYGRCAACGWDEWKIHEGTQQPQILPDSECFCEEVT